MGAKISYDPDHDLLYYSTGEPSLHSVSTGDISIDIGNNRTIVGIEIEGAKDFLSEMMGQDIGTGDLRGIRDIRLTSKRIGDVLSVVVTIEISLDGDIVQDTTEIDVPDTTSVTA